MDWIGKAIALLLFFNLICFLWLVIRGNNKARPAEKVVFESPKPKTEPPTNRKPKENQMLKLIGNDGEKVTNNFAVYKVVSSLGGGGVKSRHISDMLGITQSSVIYELGKLKRDGLVVRKGSHYFKVEKARKATGQQSLEVMQ